MPRPPVAPPVEYVRSYLAAFGAQLVRRLLCLIFHRQVMLALCPVHSARVHVLCGRCIKPLVTFPFLIWIPKYCHGGRR